MSEQVHGVCGACGSGITVEDGLVVGRDDADLLASLAAILWAPLHPESEWDELFAHGRAAIAKAKGETP